MATINVGPAITKEAINSAATQMVGTLDMFKTREQALSAILGQITDADLVALGYTQGEVTFIRTGIATLDQMVTQGLANPTIKNFTDRLRNFGQ
jgi:hypothetical protein